MRQEAREELRDLERGNRTGTSSAGLSAGAELVCGAGPRVGSRRSNSAFEDVEGTGASASSQEVQAASGFDWRVLLFKKGGSTSTKAGGKAITGGGLGSSSLLSSLSSLDST